MEKIYMNKSILTRAEGSRLSGKDLKIIIDDEKLNSLGEDVYGAFNIETNEIVLRENFERRTLLHEAVHYLFNTGDEKLHDWVGFNLENDYWDIEFWFNTLVVSAGYEFDNDTEFIDEIAAHTIELDYQDGIKSKIIQQIPLLSYIWDGKYGGIK
jgi:hypothetical protein